MIVYFADRHMNILGVASDLLPGVFHIRDDMKTSEIESGLSTFEVTIDYKKENHITLKKYVAAGNFLLVREKDNTYIPYTIIDREDDIADRHVYVYAEDAGLDLLNEIVPAYEAVQATTAADYVLAFTADSGFEIGINEIAKNDDGTDKKRTLNWDSESTATERIRSVATEFDNAEIGYSFTIDKFRITHKYINLYKKHGKDVSLELRFGREVDSIVEKESVANLVTALRCVGGTPEATDANPDPLPITLVGYRYDDGDIYTDGVFLKSREANKKWSRYLTESGTGEGYIVGSFDYDTTSQQELCNRAITELKKLREPEITYEVALNTLPENLKLGDTCRIVDDNGELYVSARLIELKVSECNRTREATFGDFRKLTSGINDKVEKLAEEFAKIQAAKTLYTWIVFADDNQGTNLSTDSFGKSYIGIATNKISSTPDLHPDNPLQVYTFSRINAIDGRGFTVKGSWAPNTSYSITGTNIDVVEYEGSTYACNNSHVSGQTFDPSKWVLIAEKGTDGQDGQDGTNGSDGLSLRGVLVRNNWNDASWQSHGVIGYTPSSGYTNYDILGSTTPEYTTPKLDTSSWQVGDFFQITGTSTDTGLGYVVTCKFISASDNKKKIYATTESISYAEKGTDGEDGEDGYSPIATVTKSGSTATITITDKNGTTTETVSDGRSITGVTNYYLATSASSGVTRSTSGWTTSVQSMTSTNQYLWNYEELTYSSGTTTTYTDPVIIGRYGQDGQGGSAGKGITGITEYYQVSSSNSQAPTTWVTTPPTTTTSEPYLWNYEVITYTTGDPFTSEKRVIGTHGATGATGETGQSSYTFIRYSANADGSNMTTTPQSDTAYMGVYTVTASSEPSVPSYTAFTWSKYVGEDGNGIYSKTDYYMLADTMDSSELSTAKAHFPHDVSGSPIGFNNAMGGIPFDNFTISILGGQNGSGDPSPTNIREFTGFAGANVVVSPTLDAEDGTTYSISWEEEAGTVYNGTLDISSGILTVTYRLIDMGSMNWSKYSNYSDHMFRWINNAADKLKKPGILNVKSDRYKTTSTELISMEDLSIRGSAASGYIYVTNSGYTSDAEFKTAMAGAKILYEYNTPPTYKVNVPDILSLIGENHIWADTGDISLTYYDEVNSSWSTDPLEPNAYAKYLWWKYGTVYTDDLSTEVMSDPAIIGVYNQDWYDETQKAISSAENAQNTANDSLSKANSASDAAAKNSKKLDAVERRTTTLEGNVQGTQNDISSLLTIVGSSDTEGLRKFRKEASDTLDYLQKTLGYFTAWMEFKSRQENPDDKTGLIIGKIANTGEYVVQIEGDAISFYENLDAARTSDQTKRVAFFQNHYLYVDNAKIGGNMEIDSFRFIPQANGNLSFVYIGGIE